jgi:putative DNA-invertase from lambdoid prophage Rac
MKVFGYCRVSTTEQANGGLSLDTQRQQITGYAMMKGWQISEFFVEAGVSGSVPLADRPEGRRLLSSLQPGDVIITAKLDRAFRSASDALGTLEQLKDDKIALHMIDLGGDVTGNGISKLVFTILSAVAEMSATGFASACATPSATAHRSGCSTAENGPLVSMSWVRARISTLFRTRLSRMP